MAKKNPLTFTMVKQDGLRCLIVWEHPYETIKLHPIPDNLILRFAGCHEAVKNGKFRKGDIIRYDEKYIMCTEDISTRPVDTWVELVEHSRTADVVHI